MDNLCYPATIFSGNNTGSIFERCWIRCSVVSVCGAFYIGNDTVCRSGQPVQKKNGLIRCRGSGVRCRVSGVEYQVLGVRYQVSGVGYQVSGVRIRKSCCSPAPERGVENPMK